MPKLRNGHGGRDLEKKNKTHPVIKDVSEALCYPTLAKEDALWLR